MLTLEERDVVVAAMRKYPAGADRLASVEINPQCERVPRET